MKITVISKNEIWCEINPQRMMDLLKEPIELDISSHKELKNLDSDYLFLDVAFFLNKETALSKKIKNIKNKNQGTMVLCTSSTASNRINNIAKRIAVDQQIDVLDIAMLNRAYLNMSKDMMDVDLFTKYVVNFLKKKERKEFIHDLHYGACVYPERESWLELKDEIKQIKISGINTVRLGEFFWSKLEPESVKYLV
jgi:hypothetical protein